MIGAGMMQSASNMINADYNMVISPSSITDIVPNGTYISPTMAATVYNGTGPFEYAWTYSVSPFDGQLVNPTPSTCQAYIPRFDASVDVSVQCIVTDLGNGNAGTSASCILSITFE